MDILIINQSIPFPPVSGGDARVYHLMRALATRHKVTLVGFNCGNGVSPPPFPVQVSDCDWEMPPLWKDMVAGEPHVWQLAYEKLLNATDEPWFVSCMQSEAMEILIRQVVARQSFDLAIVNRTNMARFLSVLPPRLPRVLNLHIVHALMAQRAVEGKAGQEKELALYEAERTLRFERQAARKCNLCLAVSEREAAAARSLLGIDHVQIIPNGVDTTEFTPGDERLANGHLLFTGKLDSAPNIEAVHYLVKRVLPLIQREVADVKVHIVGANATAEVVQLASDDVIVQGRPSHPQSSYHQASIVIVPVLHGGGTRHQILEAAACGKAIVSTSRGAEGLELRAGEELLIADEPGALAGAVVRLLRNEGLRRQLGKRALRACQQYEWDRIGAHFCRIIENLVKPVLQHRRNGLGRPHRMTVEAGADKARVMQ
jgi:glycosyltransferase involved in cell wall biosynthesis